MIRTLESFKEKSWDAPLWAYSYKPTAGIGKETILFYHGKSERANVGNNSGSQIAMVENNSLPRVLKVDGIRTGLELEYNVLAPQEVKDAEWWGNNNRGVRMANTLFAGQPIHKAGLSLGSMKDIDLLDSMGPVLKSLCTCCGLFTANLPKGMAELVKIPSIHFYDPADKTILNGVGYQSVRDGVAWLKAQGADATLVELPGKGHNVWDYAFSEGHYLNWLRQKFPVTPPPEPVKEVIKEQYIENGKLVTIGVNGTKIIN